ncbi:MAG: hypothetical protein Q9208_008521 [Pyrenodesmia sp. 3 TL-2023]
MPTPTPLNLSAQNPTPLPSDLKTNVPDVQSSRGVTNTDRNIEQTHSLSPVGEDDANLGRYGHHVSDDDDADIDVVELEQWVGLTEVEVEGDEEGVGPLGGWREEMGWWGEWWAFVGFARWMD